MFVTLLQRLRPLRGLPLWVRYLATALIVLCCFGMRYLLVGTGDPESLPLYLMFVPAVIVSSFAFDRGSGFFAVGLSAVLGLYFFIEPHQSFGLHHIGEVIRLVVFIIVGSLTAAIVEALRSTVDELDDTRRRLSAEYVHLSAADRQKDLLLADLNHRIKNHLQSIMGLLSMSARRLEDVDGARLALEAAASRLSVLGRVYDRLQISQNVAVLDARDFISNLCADLKSTIGELRPIAIRVDAEQGPLDSNRAVTIGLIINELVTNAFKYAFPDGREGEIHVCFRRSDNRLSLIVADDGVGLGAAREGSTGVRLVKALARQLGGHAEWSGPPGTRVLIEFPEEADSQQVF